MTDKLTMDRAAIRMVELCKKMRVVGKELETLTKDLIEIRSRLARASDIMDDITTGGLGWRYIAQGDGFDVEINKKAEDEEGE